MAINSLHEFMPLFIIKTMLYLISSDIYQYQWRLIFQHRHLRSLAKFSLVMDIIQLQLWDTSAVKKKKKKDIPPDLLYSPVISNTTNVIGAIWFDHIVTGQTRTLTAVLLFSIRFLKQSVKMKYSTHNYLLQLNINAMWNSSLKGKLTYSTCKLAQQSNFAENFSYSIVSKQNWWLKASHTWMTALNQQVFPTLRMPTGQSSCRIQSAGLQLSPDASHLFLFMRAAFSSALTSRALQ